jgi:hypothetical protein
MDAIKLFSQANDLQGNFMQVGFGKGLFIKPILDSMNGGTLTKRDTWIFDSFKGVPKPTREDLILDPNLRKGFDPGRLQVAMDMRYTLVSPIKNIEVVNGFVEDTLPTSYNHKPLACVHIDMSSYSSTLHVLNAIHRYMVRDGIIYVSDYGIKLSITRAVDTFLEKNELDHQVFEFEGVKYLRNKIAPVSFAPQPVTKAGKAPEKGIKVERPAPLQPFEDRYIKKEIPKFVKNDTVKEGLTLLDKKVTR